MIQRVFGIGFNKTGTKTLQECARILGYRCYSCDKDLLKDVVIKKDLTKVKEIARNYTFFDDWPWPLIYKELDVMFPGSKFILTERANSKIWYESLKMHSMKTHPTKHCRKLAYGDNYPHKYEMIYRRNYLSHCARAILYFNDRKNDFLEVCWENDDGWEKLCKFLDKPVPDVSFPYMNKGSDNKPKKSWFVINKILSKIGI